MIFLKGVLLVQIFVLICVLSLTIDINRAYTTVSEFLSLQRVLLPFSGLQISERQGEIFLQENNVLLAGTDNTPDKILAGEYNANTTPENLIGAHIQALALAERSSEETMTDPEEDSAPAEENEDEAIPPETLDAQTLARLKNSAIFLYCTHSAESYIPNSGKARLDGQRGLINQVAATIEQTLNKSGIAAEFIDTIHDYPDYNKSYTNSRATVTQIVKNNKNILGLFDIHRDSIPGEGKASTVTIKGKKTARILIVVGTNERKPNPNWQQNRAFAEQIYKTGEKMYPGLIKGVITKAGTYNQEFNTRALLLEFGSDQNTLDDVTNAAQFFTDVLIEVLKEAK
jgi:stage II sporulation protein P